jgi:hypothetical protein
MPALVLMTPGGSGFPTACRTRWSSRMWAAISASPSR